ncbi:acetyltransferase-like isoleucine patch superfamily enzyme [Arthrobacter sp. PL16]|uniref:acyltransferase n=1 Tax=Arthrobacter sp. PL16 TaxID=3071720 RepID=UPI002DFB27C0|nr:acetyltransferase-like isoleucine patch superfamily enzyme [Arthrobacter sp. PL16]
MINKRLMRATQAHAVGRLRGALAFLPTGRIRLDAGFIYRFPKLDIYGDLIIGKRFIVMSRIAPASFSVAEGARLLIADDVFINQGTRIHAQDKISIGARTEIADFVAIYDTNFHAVAPLDPVICSPVAIGDDCWIGAGATILPGVTLGRGCVVAAGSVVTKSFGQGTLVGGNPAKALRIFEVPESFRRRGVNRSEEDVASPLTSTASVKTAESKSA